MLQQLIHNGVVVPPPPEYLGLSITVREERRLLTPKQEEMALAFARKKDTPYVQDAVFVANFMTDFSAALGIEPVLWREQVDFSACFAQVDVERAAKEALSKEERKALAAERKLAREEIKARCGFAMVNGQRIELGTYLVEPSGIFMGRGQHPLRGRWKEGAKQQDITLNLSPDAPRPEGDWAEIVWQSESLWVARWNDKLTDKLKYIWFSDTAPVKQEREAHKFDKAIRLEARLEAVRQRIQEALSDTNERTRMIATAAYLIDALCLRVGDEKDPDEADTVGATTLRPEHLALKEDGSVEFRFLGKDSVEWHKTLTPPPVVLENLRHLIAHARPSRSASEDGREHPTRNLPQLFPDVTSSTVNSFLSGAMPGLSAKVFRTHHATEAVRQSLAHSGVAAPDPEHQKWRAASLANLEAAMLCNHTKQYNGNWELARERYQERRAKNQERVERLKQQLQASRDRLAALREEARAKQAAETDAARRKAVRERYAKRLASTEARVEADKERRLKAEIALDKLKAQHLISDKKRTWNLGTSLKSYIDPRVYHAWGKQVAYDVLERYYPATLRRKYLWVQAQDEENAGGSDELGTVTARACLTADLAAVAELFRLVRQAYPSLALPDGAASIGEHFLPTLDRAWRESLVILGEDDQVLAFAVLGPEWSVDDGAFLDLFCLLRPDSASEALAALVVSELDRRLDAYRMAQPRTKAILRPQDESWLVAAPGMAELYGLLPEEDDLEPVGEVEEPQTDEDDV